ncbi:two-component system histidine kinase PnpS [Aeribacillus pallidus]|uniref:histidine kinase n=1 Tax=Aeribacillus pallidus TaxID=33936 RepID=A0A165YJJ0_9BACI|nr:ATP-binding protein [Aeribacillus pallidus]KZN97149.1 PAS domain-containing sensor histidine kinase [Aeribacillus pallidus]
MSKFRSKLLLAFTALIITVLLGFGFILGQLFQSFYFINYEKQFKKEAELIKLVIENEKIGSTEMKHKMEEMSEKLNSLLLFMDMDGNIVFKTGPSFHQSYERLSELILTNHRNAKEGFRLDLDQADLLFYGIPIFQQDERKGFLVFGTSIKYFEAMNKEIWFFIIGSLIAALTIILIFGTRIMKQYTKPIESATEVAMELAKGNYKARTYENSSGDETSMLSKSINILARNLQDMTRTQELHQERLQTLIENMGSGLLFIDERGYISLMNKAFKEIFQINQEDYLYKSYQEAIAYKEIIQMVEEIFLTESNIRKHIMLPVNIERKHFEVYGAPIIGKSEVWKGVVLVFHDITELKKLEQIRKDFVANVSHELKTPITSIKGFSETLLDGAMKDEQTLHFFLSIILKESERMQSLIQDLLDLSKIEQQGFQLELRKCNVNEFLKEIHHLLDRKAKEKNIDFILDVPDEPVFIEGDPHRLKQIFINLASNGIMYTPAGGKVTLSVKAGHDEVAISVQDTGIGIREEEIPRIFERFYRVDKARSRNSGGTGLGLAIVKHLVEAHQANLTVKSTVGVGTTFTVTFQRYNE